MIPAASGDSDGAGELMITFAWPATQVGSYVVCAVDVTKGYSLRASQPFVVTSSTQASLRSNSPVVSGHMVNISGAHFIPDFGSVGIFYGPLKSGGCTVQAATGTVSAGGTFDASFDAPIVSRNQVLIVTAVAPEDGCGASRVEVEAQIEVLVVPVPPPPPGAFSSNADNPLNLPTGVMQILFAFTTLSGLASLLRFFWDSLLSALKLIPRRSRVPV
jgi:hypothetical protein